MNNHWEKIYTIIFLILIIIALLLIANIHEEFLLAMPSFKIQEKDRYKNIISLFVILIGVLVEHKVLIKGIREGLKLNIIKLIISLVIIILLFIPYNISMSITGISIASIILQDWLFRGIIGVLGGIYLVQSIT